MVRQSPFGSEITATLGTLEAISLLLTYTDVLFRVTHTLLLAYRASPLA